jgi:clan AA aspartic protease (TIGR02281 family)
MSQADSIPLRPYGGVYEVSILINGVVTVSGVLDSGAASLVISERIARKLVRNGTLTNADFRGIILANIADGSTVVGREYLLQSVKVGLSEAKDVIAVVLPGSDVSVLLGQSFLQKFSSWQIDNANSALVLGAPVSSVGSPEYPHSRKAVGDGGGSTDAPCPPNYCKRLNGEDQLSCFRMCRARRKNN